MQPRGLYLGVASKNLQKDLSARGLYLTFKKTHDVGFFTCQVQCPGFTIPGQKPKVRMGEVQSPRLPTLPPIGRARAGNVRPGLILLSNCGLTGLR